MIPTDQQWYLEVHTPFDWDRKEKWKWRRTHSHAMSFKTAVKHLYAMCANGAFTGQELRLRNRANKDLVIMADIL